MPNYLHGAETITVATGSRSVNVVKSSVIGLIGIAPLGTPNTMKLVLSKADAATYGSASVPGFTIPKSLEAIFAHGATAVLVINVFDPNTHTTAVALETHVLANSTTTLSFAPVGTVNVFRADGTTPTTAVLNTDYTISATGLFTVLTAHADLANGTTLKFSYSKLNASAVNASHINGAFNSTTGVRTGMELWDLAYNLYGFRAKVLIAPGYDTLSGVASNLRVKANLYRGRVYQGAPAATQVAAAITGRGPSGTINFNTSDKRVNLFYPMVKRYDAYTNADENFSYAAYAAGLRAKVDREEGYWVSLSNHELLGITGVEFPITAAINDSTTEANLLNEKGITTIFNSFGSGIRAWGNRNAAFPTATDPTNFECVLATKDVVDESIEEAMLQFLDKPINDAIIDTILETVNTFFRARIAEGALIDGVCIFDKEDNPDTEIANGHLVFQTSYLPPSPMERVTFKSLIDTAFLKTLGAQ